MSKVFSEILVDKVDEWEKEWKEKGVIENECGKMIIKIGENKDIKVRFEPKGEFNQQDFERKVEQEEN